MTEEYLILKRKMIVILLGIFISFGAIIIFYQYMMTKDNFDKNIKSLDDHIHSTFDMFLKQLEDDLSMKSLDITELYTVKNSFDKQDREELYKISKPLYDKMISQNAYIKIMTFRLSDSSAFLRIHKPEMFGDEINIKREMIIDSNRLQKAHHGFEVGKLAMSYRIVTPISYNGKHIGVLEIGIDPKYLIDKLKKLFKIKGAFLVKKSDLLYISDDMRKHSIGDFILVSGDDLFKMNIKDIDFSRRDNNIIEYKDKRYLLDYDIKIKNHKKEMSAKILFTFDIDNHLNQLNQLVKDNIINMSILFILLMVLINYLINHFSLLTNNLNIKLSKKSKELELLNLSLRENIENEVEKNRKKDQQLIEQSRLAQMGEMLSMIAHQWRQPLTAISATSASIEMRALLGKTDNNTILKQAKNISKYSQHLSQTINDFKDFFKHEKELSYTSYDDIISEVLNIVQISIESKGISITQNITTDKKVKTYHNEVKQVLLNLVKNAEDILLEQDIENPYIDISTFYDNGYLTLQVKDNAGGIPQNIVHKIFNPYFSTKKEKNGTGLGLYMSKTIIEDHCKGNLSASNDKDGAVFTIKLNKNVFEDEI